MAIIDPHKLKRIKKSLLKVLHFCIAYYMIALQTKERSLKHGSLAGIKGISARSN